VRRVRPGRQTGHSKQDWRHCGRWSCSSA